MEAQIATINSQIREIRAAITRRKKMKTRLKHVMQDIAKRQRELGYLSSTLKKEEGDVNKLEGLSVRGLFVRVLGNVREQLDVERQEYLLAVLKYNECLDIVEALQFEAAVLTEKISELPEMEKAYGSLCAKKLALLKSSDKRLAAQLTALDIQESSLQVKRVEIDEAIFAGQAATRHLKTMMNHLDKVRNWQNTTLYGSGRYSSYSKKTYIDKVRKTAMAVKLALDKFETEVQDVFRQQKITDKFEIGRFEKFLETFYDNLITDWIVQRSRSNLMNQLKGVSDKIQRILGSLEAEKSELQKKSRLAGRERKKIISAW